MHSNKTCLVFLVYYYFSDAVKLYPNEQMLGRRVTIDSKVLKKLYIIVSSFTLFFFLLTTKITSFQIFLSTNLYHFDVFHIISNNVYIGRSIHMDHI